MNWKFKKLITEVAPNKDEGKAGKTYKDKITWSRQEEWMAIRRALGFILLSDLFYVSLVSRRKRPADAGIERKGMCQTALFVSLGFATEPPHVAVDM